MPYSSAYVARTVWYGSLPGLRAAAKPTPSSIASAGPKMKPRASAPSTRSGFSGRANSARLCDHLAQRVGVRDEGHDVLEDDARLGEVADVADALAEVDHRAGV